MTDKNTFAEQMRKRTKQFALSVVRLVGEMPRRTEYFVLGKQLLRSATSVAANYRAATRGRSTTEFYSKLCIVVEEADESLFWLEMLQESGLCSDDDLKYIIKEAEEILAILAKSKKTTSSRLLQDPLVSYGSNNENIEFPHREIEFKNSPIRQFAN